MKYALFAGDQYYPLGGIFDFRGFYDTVEKAAAAGSHGSADVHGYFVHEYDWYHVVDMSTMEIVSRGSNR